MLRGNSQLTADVILYKFTEKLVIFIFNKVIKTDSAADKHLFNSLEISQLSQNIKIFRVWHLHIRARCRCKTSSVFTKSELFLLFTWRKSEVCGRSSDIAYVTLESWIIKKTFSLLNNTLFTSDGYRSALMKSKWAEITSTETTTVVCDWKQYLVDTGYAAETFITLWIPTLIRQRIDIIKLFCVKGLHRRILHKNILSVPLNEGFAPYCISLLKLPAWCNCIVTLVLFYTLVAWKFDNRLWHIIVCTNFIANTSDVVKRFNRITLGKSFCNFNCLQLAHSVHKQICLAVENNWGHYLVFPIIIMSKSSEWCLKTSDYNGRIGI